MNIVSTVRSELRKNTLFYILAFCLVSSSIVVIPNGVLFYTSGLFILLCASLKYGNSSVNGHLFIGLCLVCFLSSVMNGVLDYRLYVFMLLICSCTPIFDSPRLFIFRRKYLYYSLLIFPILSLISVYCFYAGINMCTPDIEDFEYGVTGLDFSAFYNHPMWLAASVGLSNVVYIWAVFQAPKKWHKIIYGTGLFLSIIISFASASRSALIASLIAMYIVVLLMSGNLKKVILYTIYVACAVVLLLPFYMNYSDRMVDKFEAGEGQAYGSRTEIFASGFAHFWDNPILGTGFATQWRGGHFYIGRLESGSGWLSILFQLGFCGIFIVGLLLMRAKQILKFIYQDNKLILYIGCFIFLCSHSCFEGYILTPGYYLCILFWMLLGYFISYPVHISKR